MALELTDPNTGQIKTSVIVIGGLAVVGVLILMGSKSGGGSTGVVSNGQSSGISDQLGALSGAIAGLAADTTTGTGTTGGGSGTTGSGTGGTTGGGTTGGGTTDKTNIPIAGVPPVGPITTYPSWLTDLLSRVGAPHRTNPTNPISTTTFAPGTAFANLPGGILTGQIEGIIGSGDNAAYHNFISQYTGLINANSPQNPSPGTTNLGDKLKQIFGDLATGNLQDLTTVAGGGSGGAIDNPISGGPVPGSGPNAANPIPASLFTAPTLPGAPNTSGIYQSILQNYSNVLQPNVQPVIPGILSTPNINQIISDRLAMRGIATTQPVP